jgi:hypothetical protein
MTLRQQLANKTFVVGYFKSGMETNRRHNLSLCTTPPPTGREGSSRSGSEQYTFSEFTFINIAELGATCFQNRPPS